MESERRIQYEHLTRYLEEPVRQIVPALWRLPFVKDTGFSCSGHILARYPHGSERFKDGFSWYPHRAMLEPAFYPDEELTPEMREARDAFRADLQGILVGSGDVELGFKDAQSFSADKRPYSRLPEDNIRQYFNAHLPLVEQSDDSVLLIEGLLTDLWEETASVLRKYNPSASIGPIAGTNFRTVINWAHWGTVFLRDGDVR